MRQLSGGRASGFGGGEFNPYDPMANAARHMSGGGYDHDAWRHDVHQPAGAAEPYPTNSPANGPANGPTTAPRSDLVSERVEVASKRPVSISIRWDAAAPCHPVSIQGPYLLAETATTPLNASIKFDELERVHTVTVDIGDAEPAGGYVGTVFSSYGRHGDLTIELRGDE